jgi:hypothetical protein
VVVGLAAVDAWTATVDDPDLRIAVLAWLVGLQEAGPPPAGVFDAYRDTWSVVVPGTDVTAEYIVAPFLDPPAIAFRVFG